jgi:hypothetical protein
VTDNGVSLKGGAVENERRTAFMRAVASSYDLYLEAVGEEPDAIVYVLCGIRQQSRIAWDIHGDSAGGPTSILSLAAVHCMAEAQCARQGIDP